MVVSKPTFDASGVGVSRVGGSPKGTRGRSGLSTPVEPKSRTDLRGTDRGRKEGLEVRVEVLRTSFLEWVIVPN